MSLLGCLGCLRCSGVNGNAQVPFCLRRLRTRRPTACTQQTDVCRVHSVSTQQHNLQERTLSLIDRSICLSGADYSRQMLPH